MEGRLIDTQLNIELETEARVSLNVNIQCRAPHGVSVAVANKKTNETILVGQVSTLTGISVTSLDQSTYRQRSPDDGLVLSVAVSVQRM